MTHQLPATSNTDLAIIGAGAAGLMAAIWAGRTNPNRSIVLLDGARKLGAKILISGGGRCNVTHHHVEAKDFAGSSRHAIAKVLRRFDVPQTITFFRELGVELKQEETGKLFPTTDSARTVLDALLKAAQQANVSIRFPMRVESVSRTDQGFNISGDWGILAANKVVLATGGQSVPKTGSDGHGYEIAAALGHSLTRRFPALVPLILPTGHFIRRLSGIAVPATLELRSASGKHLIAFTGSTLCTHFGISGPASLDMSRYFIDAQFADAGAQLFINWLPERNAEQIDEDLRTLGRTSVGRFLRATLPERLTHALCAQAGVDSNTTGDELPRVQRINLARTLTQMPLPITGDRGFNYAEATAGGVPLSELQLDRMESRRCPNLFICGEICDVDGRIGGFNFQWAWASGYVAGTSV